MTLLIVKIAPKQRSIHKRSLAIVVELPLIEEDTHQSSSLSSDTNQRTLKLSAYTDRVPSAKLIQTNDQYKITKPRVNRTD